MQVVFLELCSSRVAILAPQNLQVFVSGGFVYFLPSVLFFTFNIRVPENFDVLMILLNW